MSIPIVDPRLAVAGYSDDPTQKKLQIDELKKHIQGGENKDKQLHEACEGFEAVFVQKIWEQMRHGIPKSGLMESRDQEMYQSMFDVELSKKMASAGGIGLADMLYEQLNVKLGKASRATSTSMLKNSQKMKEIDEYGQGIELKPRYGSLKTDTETGLAQNKGEADPDALYNDLQEEGLEYINPYAMGGQNAPLVNNNSETGEEALQAEADGSGQNVDWKGKMSTAFNAYVGNLQHDDSVVGSISATKNVQEGKNAPQSMSSSMENAEKAETSSGIKIINTANPGTLTEVPLASPVNLPGDVQAAAASAMEIPGFSGMKTPFANAPLVMESQLLSGFNNAAMFDSAVPVGGAQSGLISEELPNAAMDTAIAPGNVVAPAAAEQPELKSSEAGGSAIPDGMFMKFDNLPNI